MAAETSRAAVAYRRYAAAAPIPVRHIWIAVAVLTAAVLAMPPLDAFQAVPAGMCRVQGKITSGPTSLPGVSLVFKNGDAVAAATSTETDGTYHAIVKPGAYHVSVALGGFSPVERDVTIDAAACGQTMDLQMTLLPRTPRSAAAAGPAGRGRGGAANGTQPFEAIAVQQQAAGALVAETAAEREAEESAARQLLPPGFSNDAPSQAVTFTGNSASLDRGMLGDRFEALGRGEFGAATGESAARFRHPRSSRRTAGRIRAGRVRRARRSRRPGRTGRTWRSRRPRWSRRTRWTWRARRPRRFRHRRTRWTSERLQRHRQLHLRRIGARRGPVSAAPRLGCRTGALQPSELRRDVRRTGQDSRRLRRHAQDELHGQLHRQPRRRALRPVRHRAHRGDACRQLLPRLGPADRSAHRAADPRQSDPAGSAEPDIAALLQLHSVAKPSGSDAEPPLHDDDRFGRRQLQRPDYPQLHGGAGRARRRRARRFRRTWWTGGTRRARPAGHARDAQRAGAIPRAATTSASTSSRRSAVTRTARASRCPSR